MSAVWCVKHSSGWCATEGGEKPSPSADSDPTVCGYVVIMRIGSEVREPDCEECRASLGLESYSKSTGP